MERGDHDVRCQVQIEQFSLDTADFRHAWQKDQETALVLRQ